MVAWDRGRRSTAVRWGHTRWLLSVSECGEAPAENSRRRISWFSETYQPRFRPADRLLARVRLAPHFRSFSQFSTGFQLEQIFFHKLFSLGKVRSILIRTRRGCSLPRTSSEVVRSAHGVRKCSCEFPNARGSRLEKRKKHAFSLPSFLPHTV